MPKYSKFTPKNHQKLIADLEKTTTEEEVKLYFSKFFDVKINTWDRHDLYTREALFEFKWDKNFEKVAERSKILAQALYYIREIKYSTGDISSDKTIPPHIVLIDRNEAIIEMTVNWKTFYDDTQYDWTRTPSSPDPQLVVDIARDDAIVTAHIYNLTEIEDFRIFTEKLDDIYDPQIRLNLDNTDKKLITEENFESVYFYWKDQIFGERKTHTKLPNLFLADIQEGKAMLSRETGDLYFNLGNTKSEVINITPSDYEYFWSLYARVRGTSTIKGIIAKIDRLSEDNIRRREGEFFTPIWFATQWLHYLSEVLGPDWHKEYKIWDMAAGTGNLELNIPAESYHNLYLSTLHSEEVDYLERIFHGANCFQYDYLNDDVDLLFRPENQDSLLSDKWKLPQKLRDDLANRANKWVVLINPPFATSQEAGATSMSKEWVSDTRVRKYMHDLDLGEVSRELFVQFIFRIQKEIPKAHLGLFSKIKYLNATNDEKFRSKIFEFAFQKWFIFSSENFSWTRGKFPVWFLIWNLGIKSNWHNQKVCIDIFNNSVQKIGFKKVEATLKSWFLSTWIERPKNTKLFPPVKSALNFGFENKDVRDRISENYIGSLMCLWNDVLSQNAVAVLSAPYASAWAHSIEENIFEKSMIIHAVRRIPKASWINDRDQFLQPKNELSEEFISDCVIWSLFADSNQTSSMRDVEYKWQLYQIVNQFFPFPKREIEEWDCPNPDIFLENSGERYVAEWLRWRILSEEARVVLNAGREVYRIFFREWTHLDRYNWKIASWDAGWYQIRNSLKEKYGMDEMKTLKDAQRKLREKLLPQIYEYGFLPEEMVENN